MSACSANNLFAATASFFFIVLNTYACFHALILPLRTPFTSSLRELAFYFSWRSLLKEELFLFSSCASNKNFSTEIR